jgi:undecaprenyl-diphosphatase
MTSPIQFVPEHRATASAERILLAAILLFVIMVTVLVQETWDSELLLAIYPGSESAALRFWTAVSSIGNNKSLILAASLLMLILVATRRFTAAVWIVAGSAVTMSIVEVLKWMVNRERPPLTFLLEPNGASFPSAHAAGPAFLYLYLAAIIAAAPSQRFAVRVLKAALLIVLPAVALAVGYSRIYAGVHWPSDVLGGWAIGTFIAGVALLNTPGEEQLLRSASQKDPADVGAAASSPDRVSAVD